MTQTLPTSILELSAADIKPTLEFAKWCDAHDPLTGFRDEFEIPRDQHGAAQAYFVGNSLGLMPKAARTRVMEELNDWAAMGAEGHMHGTRPWIRYHEFFRAGLAELAGALAHEVVAMNTLTTSCFLVVSFTRVFKKSSNFSCSKFIFCATSLRNSVWNLGCSFFAICAFFIKFMKCAICLDSS